MELLLHRDRRFSAAWLAALLGIGAVAWGPRAPCLSSSSVSVSCCGTAEACPCRTPCCGTAVPAPIKQTNPERSAKEGVPSARTVIALQAADAPSAPLGAPFCPAGNVVPASGTHSLVYQHVRLQI
jgi:hypothetical protein